ncbi:hypothetical protein C900_00141 [Fulvivirga imtechensis AK7]|uniref:KTSC domain-containing protein n=1 Tax=Fulvivirga imtechensis AK7 TaxID=1237149 RepID=L8JVH9_9BACT|nr:hypothetical protein [Fulvivirga imtechensis]ELR73061.1 hypothetical protein C900_00141 [Fulvivirga imtechensis AK7]
MKNLLLLIVCWPLWTIAQVEYNFEMEPSKTNCHELPVSFNSTEKAIETLKSTTFRLQESIKISRYRSPRAAQFYSCDGLTGFLMVEETEDILMVYRAVPQDAWSQFSNSTDPIGYYENNIKGKYATVE